MAEPVDLSGAQIQMNVYKQEYTVDLSIEKDGVIQKLSVDIDGNQKNIIDRLKSDEEKVHYLFERAREQGKI